MISVINNFRERKLFSKIKKKINIIGYRKTLPLIYLFILILGAVLTFVYAFVHSLVVCSSVFGTDFCTPTGIFIALIASLPGYVIAGNVLSFVGEVHWFLSFVIVIMTSFTFYYLLGYLIDKIKIRKFYAENLSKIIVIIFFSVLLILAIILYLSLAKN